MGKSNPVVSIFTTQWGHYSIGKAAEEILRAHNYNTNFNFIQSDKASARIYEAFYHVLPGLFRVPFKLGENKNIQKLIFQYLDKNYKQQVLQFIKLQKPTHIINTYGGFNNILEKNCKFQRDKANKYYP